MSVLVNTATSSPSRHTLVVVAVLLLGACGDDDKVNPSNPDASPSKDGGAQEAGKYGSRDAPEERAADAHRDGSGDSGEAAKDAAADVGPD